jgi:hypothetical protein
LPTLKAFNLTQFSNLTDSAIGALPAQLLAFAVDNYSLSFTNLFTIDQWSEALATTQLEFKTFVPSQVFPFELLNNLKISSASWLEIALIATNPPPQFDAPLLTQLNETSCAGLRKDQIPMILPPSMGVFNQKQLSFLLSDAVGALSIAQIAEIAPKSFGGLAVQYLSPTQIPAITPQQVVAISPDAFLALSCEQLGAFTDEQKAAMLTPQKFFLESNQLRCNQVVGTTGPSVVLPSTPYNYFPFTNVSVF